MQHPINKIDRAKVEELLGSLFTPNHPANEITVQWIGYGGGKLKDASDAEIAQMLDGLLQGGHIEFGEYEDAMLPPGDDVAGAGNRNLCAGEYQEPDDYEKLAAAPAESPVVAGLTCSVFTVPEGAKPIGKKVFLEGGEYRSKTMGSFDRLQCTTTTFASARELADFIRRAGANQHLTAGVCADEKAWVVPDGMAPEGDAGLPVIPRNNTTFTFPTGGAFMVIDSDNLNLLRVGPTEALLTAAPILANYARIEASSTGANIYGTDGTEYRGLTGQHTIFHVANGSDIPRALGVLHQHCFIAGYGIPRLAKDGTFLERSPVDRQMQIAVQPLYLRATCEEGLEQHKEVEYHLGIEVLDTRAALPNLTTEEEKQYKAAVEDLRRSLLGKSQKVRNAYKREKIDQLVARGVLEGDAEEAVEAAINKCHTLSLDWPIIASDGEETTVGGILMQGSEAWHGRTVRDPLEPDYGSDTVAKVYFNDKTVVINSMAHGGRAFMLQVDRPSAEDSFAEMAAVSSGVEINMDNAERTARIAELMQRAQQDNNALAFAIHYDGKLKYGGDTGKWYAYKDGRWVPDELGKVGHLIRIMCRGIGGAKAKETKHHNAIEAMCKKDPVFAVKASQTFDRDNYLLNTSQGVINLRTGKMLEHSPDLYVTKATRVAPSIEGGTRFLQFLDEITLGDLELIEFLQVSLGACLSGAVESHWLLFWIGTGRNGKNTLGDLVMWIMGDYAKKIPATTLMAKDHEGHPTEMASLLGVRLGVSSEIEQGAFWQEAKVNELTGDGTISARFMRQDFFEFERTHKHLIYGNNRPRLKTVTDALKARIKIVPFKASFLGREDPELPAKLQAEAGFVLTWLIEGHRKWLAAGRKLPTCAAVDAESADYFDNQSVVEMWVAEHLQAVPDDGRPGRRWPAAKSLYDDYSKWKVDRGEKPLSMSLWGEAMTKRFDKIRADGIRYMGCLLDPQRFHERALVNFGDDSRGETLA